MILIAFQGPSLEILFGNRGAARQKCYFFAHVILHTDTRTAGLSLLSLEIQPYFSFWS